jgi:hypothetical protein
MISGCETTFAGQCSTAESAAGAGTEKQRYIGSSASIAAKSRRVGAVLGVSFDALRPGVRLWAGGNPDCSYGNQFGEVDERIAQMLRRERRESDALSDGVRDC